MWHEIDESWVRDEVGGQLLEVVGASCGVAEAVLALSGRKGMPGTSRIE